MKKKSIISVVLAGILALGLAGCGAKKTDDKTITIGVSPVPHKEIVEQIKPILEKEGYKLEIKEFDDYELPNTAVQDGEIDANYFQHIAYLNTTNEKKNYDLTYTAEIHIEPMALYSTKVKNLNELKDGATIGIPNDPSNEARALRLLAKAGLIKVKDGELITIADVTENTKNIKFKELEAAQLPRTLDELNGAVINGNYALEAKLDATKDALFTEDKNDESIKNYRNILAVKKGNEDSEKIKALTKALTSDEVKKYITDTYKGAVVPVF
ncbi:MULTISPECIES: MetQ/NlpA family ABC transporter substrate-binding protein [Clostridium]|uniref:Lipoprotein n=1 Tax=Clostridium cibarium TaxID=2762247 RepID=A0ABR8PXZ8_9CLOT|nr:MULTISPECIES: MetQ/NlpA family ABC transporter substrate-binding protein [Clostridium]MBD7913037.1 MetQ/NlpA family ABC transporter substrate-binding protein [Clostridium cibarium]